MKKWSIRTAGRSFFLCLTAITFLALGQAAARADEVTIAGATGGAISAGLSPHLFYNPNPSFTVTTVMGMGSLSHPNSLGEIFLRTAPQPQALSGSFTLFITFTSPDGITGGQSTSFTATVTGIVSPFVGIEGVTIDFDNTPMLFTFNDGVNSGSFTLALADLFLPSGSGGQLTARVTGSQTVIPEPATLILLGTGLVGVAAGARRGRRRFRERK